MKRSRVPRETATLSESVHQRLNMYALAAGAAGVSVLALAQPADAKIVYTKTYSPITRQGLGLDLNNDRKLDFYFSIFTDATTYTSTQVLQISAYGSRPNAVVASAYHAKAFKAGKQIGPGRRFQLRAGLATVVERSHSGNSTFKWTGQWGNKGRGLKNRYLGLRFVINGELHYAWARVSVFIITGRHFSPFSVLTGYAYETIPNKPIIAGKTHYADVEQPASAFLTRPAPEPATLGMLSLGAPALSIWRREDPVGARER